MGGYTIYKRLLKQSKEMEKQIKQIKKQMKDMPEGKLICCKDKWYLSDGHKKTYIKKKDRALAEKLAAKKYLSALLEDLEKEKSAIDMYLRHSIKDNGKVKALFMGSSEILNLLSPQFYPLSRELDNWMKSPYQKNIKHSEHLTQKVGSMEYVRSKSEAMIVKVLKQYKIPYRYECQLVLGEVEFYPDFTIRHPKTGKMYIWEHFGLLDKIDYVKNMNSKMQIYTENNILPGINLITTYETKECPLTYEMVELLVKYYFT